MAGVVDLLRGCVRAGRLLGHDIFHFIGRVLAYFGGFLDSLVACTTGASLALSGLFYGGTGFFILLNDRPSNRRTASLGLIKGLLQRQEPLSIQRDSHYRYLCATGDAPIGRR